LVLTLNDVPQLSTVIGRSTGTNQLVGMFLINIIVPDTILTIRNPSGNVTTISITPSAGGGAYPVSAHLIITRIN
jgi:hypothetical protein